eukprot:6197229-Pleurochrysis_carterae.AAC.1
MEWALLVKWVKSAPACACAWRACRLRVAAAAYFVVECRLQIRPQQRRRRLQQRQQCTCKRRAVALGFHFVSESGSTLCNPASPPLASSAGSTQAVLDPFHAPPGESAKLKVCALCTPC